MGSLFFFSFPRSIKKKNRFREGFLYSGKGEDYKRTEKKKVFLLKENIDSLFMLQFFIVR